MKKLILFAVLLCNAGAVLADNTMADLFARKTKLVFLGLDFTQAKYVGAVGFTDPTAIQNQHIVSWNNLIEMEPKKFSLQKAFSLADDQYVSRVEDMVKLNKSVNVAENITETEHAITEEQVKKSVSEYALSEKDGVGVVYVVESLSKTAERMSAWVTFIDLKTKKVLHTERVEGKAGGFGFRNYWAGAVYKITQEIDSRLYMKWRKAFKG
ncbi:hypothetical protein [Dyadobacter sp. CY343]|uniref:hypothetical protein n=1 Tax=Dyadobacter sp. CY343 TaxID=2907299 RepID=UPI001F2FBB6D|nr:hypothetical protein [Dyadobacter sp. CY343]MCE7059640.1 hypothetical protein [Dyadobacter sp. CY343]